MGNRVMDEHRCPICDKDFYPPDITTWAYRCRQYNGDEKLYCSWHCLRVEQVRKQEKKKQRSAVAAEIFKLLSEGLRMVEIAEKLSVTIDTVKYWRAKYQEGA